MSAEITKWCICSWNDDVNNSS